MGGSKICVQAECFDLRAICRSGQVFRMYEPETGIFDVYSADRHLRIIQKDDHSYEFMCGEAEYETYWRKYFDLTRNYASIVKKALSCGDAFVASACERYSGIRILHQNIWEMMISFIISQQKQIPSIRRCIEGLCGRFGEPKSDEYGSWYTFPAPEAIASGGADGLKGLSLGYRERYIYETARQYLDHGISDEALEAMSYEDAKRYLLGFTGIGEKVANCILLFGAGFVDAFPIDTHIKDILQREYYYKSRIKCGETLTQADYENLTAEFFDCFRPVRGIVQQWIFAAEIE